MQRNYLGERKFIFKTVTNRTYMAKLACWYICNLISPNLRESRHAKVWKNVAAIHLLKVWSPLLSIFGTNFLCSAPISCVVRLDGQSYSDSKFLLDGRAQSRLRWWIEQGGCSHSKRVGWQYKSCCFKGHCMFTSGFYWVKKTIVLVVIAATSTL